MAKQPATQPLTEFFAAPPEPHIGSSAVDKVLQAIRTHLNMDVAFVAEFRKTDRVFRHVSARNRAPIHQGDAVPLDQGYCQRVVDGRLPELIPDASVDPLAKLLPETRALPIGAHLSVPIRLANGRIYGTFCCFSFSPDPSLSQRDLQIMKVFAELLSDQIERDLEHLRARDEKYARISDALAYGQPSIVYQPIFDLETNSVAGVECLARFRCNPSRSPDQWFDEAGQVGLRTQLETLAIEKALDSMKSLRPEIYLSLNCSPETLSDNGMMKLMQRVDPGRVVLELTEHEHIPDYGRLLNQLGMLRGLGVRIAIDDAGAGYANMRHILNIQPDQIKLDMSLTRQIDRDPTRRALASALIAFANETHGTIIAEGVETDDELNTLKGLGVTRAQGYLLGRPMPLEDLMHLAHNDDGADDSASDAA